MKQIETARGAHCAGLAHLHGEERRMEEKGRGGGEEKEL